MTHAKIHKTASEILYSWLNWRQLEKEDLVRNSDMAECRKFGLDNFRQSYNVATYERKFREARKKYSWRFKDVSDQFENRTEKTWKIKPK